MKQAKQLIKLNLNPFENLTMHYRDIGVDKLILQEIVSRDLGKEKKLKV